MRSVGNSTGKTAGNSARTLVPATFELAVAVPNLKFAPKFDRSFNAQRSRPTTGRDHKGFLLRLSPVIRGEVPPPYPVSVAADRGRTPWLYSILSGIGEQWQGLTIDRALGICLVDQSGCGLDALAARPRSVAPIGPAIPSDSSGIALSDAQRTALGSRSQLRKFASSNGFNSLRCSKWNSGESS